MTNQASSKAERPTPSFQISVSVDNNHCHLYAICVQEAPEVFDMSVDGRIRYTSKPAAHLYEKVWNAARLCPMQAILIEPAQTITVPTVMKRQKPSPAVALNTSDQNLPSGTNIGKLS